MRNKYSKDEQLNLPPKQVIAWEDGDSVEFFVRKALLAPLPRILLDIRSTSWFPSKDAMLDAINSFRLPELEFTSATNLSEMLEKLYEQPARNADGSVDITRKRGELFPVYASMDELKRLYNPIIPDDVLHMNRKDTELSTLDEAKRKPIAF